MKRMSSTGKTTRFKGGIRGCQRAVPERFSWDEWVNGEGTHTRPKRNWLKLIIIILALLALGGIFAALVIELGRG